jgi:hypothetical protein
MSHNPESRTVTFHLENGDITIPYTTYRQLMANGGKGVTHAVIIAPRVNAVVRSYERSKDGKLLKEIASLD